MLGLDRNNTLVALSLFLWGLGSGLYQFVWPLYIKTLGANSVEIGLAIAFGSVVAIIIFIPGGMAADRYSRKKNMIACWVLGTAAVLVYAIAQDWRQLLLGIALMSASQFCDPALSAYIAEAGKGRDLGQTFTLVFAGMSLGMVISPPLGGLIMQGGDMRPLFYIAFVIYALSSLTICFIKDQSRSAPAVDNKRGYGHLILNKRLLLLFAFVFAAYMASYLGRSFSAVYLEEVSGMSRTQIGSLGAMISIGSVVLALGLGVVSSRIGVIWALVAAQGLIFVGNMIFLSASGMVPAALAYFLWGAGNPLSSLLRGVLGQEFKAELSGRGYAIQNALHSLAMAMAPYASGWLYVSHPDLPFIAGLALLPLVVAGTIGLRQRGLIGLVKA